MNTMIKNPPSTPTTDTEATRKQYLVPRVNIVETPNEYVLEAEMPGVTKSGLEISLENQELTLIGHRTPVLGNVSVLYRESSPRDFRRAFELEPSIDTAKIDARIDNGLLTLTLPKVEQVKPRRIEISG